MPAVGHSRLIRLAASVSFFELPSPLFPDRMTATSDERRRVCRRVKKGSLLQISGNVGDSIPFSFSLSHPRIPVAFDLRVAAALIASRLPFRRSFRSFSLSLSFPCFSSIDPRFHLFFLCRSASFNRRVLRRSALAPATAGARSRCCKRRSVIASLDSIAITRESGSDPHSHLSPSLVE